MSPYDLPPPRRITASNLTLPSQHRSDKHAEPGVEIKIDSLQVESILGGTLMRAMVATSKQVPTSNDGQSVCPHDRPNSYRPAVSSSCANISPVETSPSMPSQVWASYCLAA
jgi:hypothetical protein